MTPYYVLELTLLEGQIVLALLVCFLFVFSIVLPMLPRKQDKKCGIRLGQIRVIAIFYGTIFSYGGAFFRFSLYQNCLVICFLTARAYPLEKIQFQKSFKGGNSLSLVLDGVPVKVYGASQKLEKFVKALAARLVQHEQ